MGAPTVTESRPGQPAAIEVPADAAARRELARSLVTDVGAFVGNRWRHDLTGPESTVVDPSTGERVLRYRMADVADVDAAVEAARAGLAAWRATVAPERAAVLRRIGAAITDHADELALLTSLETGTPLEFSRDRMRSVPASWFDYYAGWCDKLVGDTIPATLPGQLNMTVAEPVGVVVKLVTWNSPIGGVQMSVPAALAAGCSVVLRPPEIAPLTLTRFAQLCVDCGLPPGVVNVLPGGPEVAEALIRHPAVRKVSFTGGPAVAREIQRVAADSLTPLVLELGGKSANIVFPDADLPAAVGHAAAICGLSGQGCTLPSRLFVHRAVYDEVVTQLAAVMDAVPVGDAFAATTRMGPLISAAALERVTGMIERARQDGASVRRGGGRPAGVHGDGYFVAPTIIEGVPPHGELMQREVFGPVVCATPFDTEDEVVELANGTAYGLAAYVHSNDLGRVMRLVPRLEAGSVSINGAGVPSGAHAPFGGQKESGYGREGGREGVLEFTHFKTVSVRL